MKINAFVRWYAPVLLLTASLTGSGPALAQFAALRQPSASSEAVAPPQAPDRNQPPEIALPQPKLEADKLSPLKPFLLYGIEGQYRGSVLPGGSYRLESAADVSSIKLIYGDTPEDAYGRRQIRAKFRINGQGSAGLLYGHQQNPTQYFLLIVDANQTFRVLERTPQGFSQLVSTNFEAKAGDDVELSLTENGPELQVTLNGDRLLSLSNDRTGRGAVGVATIGAGTFDFQSFELKID